MINHTFNKSQWLIATPNTHFLHTSTMSAISESNVNTRWIVRERERDWHFVSHTYIVTPIFKKFTIKTLGVWCQGFLACAGLSTIKTFLVYNGHHVGEEFSHSGFPFGVFSISFLLHLYIMHLLLYDMVHVGIQLINLLHNTQLGSKLPILFLLIIEPNSPNMTHNIISYPIFQNEPIHLLGRKWANAPFKKTIQQFASLPKLIREMPFFWNSIFSKSSYKKKKNYGAL